MVNRTNFEIIMYSSLYMFYVLEIIFGARLLHLLIKKVLWFSTTQFANLFLFDRRIRLTWDWPGNGLISSFLKGFPTRKAAVRSFKRKCALNFHATRDFTTTPVAVVYFVCRKEGMLQQNGNHNNTTRSGRVRVVGIASGKRKIQFLRWQRVSSWVCLH